MKLGFLTSLMRGYTFEETIEIASQLGYECVELACWPEGAKGGPCHLNPDTADLGYVKDFCASHGVELTSLGFYPNNLDPDIAAREANLQHLKKLIVTSAKLGIGLVTTFIGRDPKKTVKENFETFDKVWPDMIRFAEDNGVKIGIENCPMLFQEDQWPGGLNMASTPAVWREMFSRIPSPNFGLNLDPSHLAMQMIDYVEPIYEFKDRIFHTHFKDVRLNRKKLNSLGCRAFPHDYMDAKIPGLGTIDWSAFVSALKDVGYAGPAVVEVEDNAFWHNEREALELSRRYLRQFII